MTVSARGTTLLSIVVPTIGRESLGRLLTSLRRTTESGGQPCPPVFVVDDRRDPAAALHIPEASGLPVTVVSSGGRGPAAARNVGWRRTKSDWIAFLDDDVEVSPSWAVDVARDIDQPADVGAVDALIEVPLPSHRRPTDWERGTAGLASARWITADMCVRRSVLTAIGGFDERFPRAFREDSDLALRIGDAGFVIATGSRKTCHPVRPAGRWASLRQQRGNADDVLMDRLHGRGWRARAEAPLGRRPQHLLTCALAACVPLGLVTRRRSVAIGGLVGWMAMTAEFSWRRIEPGPRDRAEVTTMVATSAAIPLAATWAWVKAQIRWRRGAPAWTRLPAAVLLDRDGTIVKDVPYNGDPEKVEPVPGAADALARLRAAGVPLAVVSNQSGIGRGLLRPAEVAAVNARIDDVLGPFDAWFVCPHTDRDRCGCRKPEPGLVRQAAQSLGVPVQRCVVIGDIGADVGAAGAAGAAAIIVPTAVTLPHEVSSAPRSAATLGEAVDMVLAGDY